MRGAIRLGDQSLLDDSGDRSFECQLSGQHLAHDRAKAIDVARRADTVQFAADLFGRHVRGRFDHQAGLCEVGSGFRQASQPEVHDHRLFVVIDDDIRRLEIAMHDASLMRLLDRLRELQDQQRDLTSWQCFAGARCFASVSPSMYAIVKY